jgi:hypothetical protein
VASGLSSGRACEEDGGGMKQEIGNGSGNVQIIGSDNKVSFEPSGYSPSPDNPNLITCPACDWYGVFRGADQCPSCHYSFLNERLAVQAEVRRRREQGLVILFLMGLCVLAVSIQISSKFDVSFLKGLGWGVMIVLSIFASGLWSWARFTTWNKFRHRNK